MIYIVRRRGKWLSMCSYATGLGHRYRWTTEPWAARWFERYDMALNMANQCGGRVWSYDKGTRRATIVSDPQEHS